MSAKTCDACGRPTPGGIIIGGAYICRRCDPEIRDEIDRRRAANEPVNALHIARRIYRRDHAGGNYLLRDIPQELWTRAKHRALDDGMSLRELILTAVREYIDDAT